MLTITQPDIRLKKNGDAWAQKNASQTLTHEEFGYYEIALDATDTNTLGRLRVAVSESGALPVWQDFVVVPANVHDSLVGQHATDKLEIDVAQVAGQSATVASTPIDANLTKWIGTPIPGVDTAGYPKVTIKDGTGAGEIDTNIGSIVNVLNKALLGESETIDDVTSQTEFTFQNGDVTTSAYKDWIAVFTDASSATVPKATSIRRVVSSGLAFPGTQFTINSAPSFMVATGDTIELYPPDLEILTRLPDASPAANGGLATLDANLNVQADLEAIDDDTAAPANAESFFDGTGYGPMLLHDTVSNVSSQTTLELTNGISGVNTFMGCRVVLRDNTSPGSGAPPTFTGVITGVSGISDEITFAPDGTAPFTIANGDIVEILPL